MSTGSSAHPPAIIIAALRAVRIVVVLRLMNHGLEVVATLDTLADALTVVILVSAVA